MAAQFSYSDGTAIEAQIVSILRGSSKLNSEVSVGEIYYHDFAVRYHLCRQRSNLLRHLDFEGLDVLELGAGMGGVSRFMAERAAHLTAVEGSGNRLSALKSRLRDLDNWEAHESTIQNFKPERLYDVVCLVGVLEYSELYVKPESGESPFEWVLQHARSMLKPDGVLLIAIENRLGLKYWAGAAEDHTSRLFDGICGYGQTDSPRTFSRRALLELAEKVGFTSKEEFYPWPDYKLPTAVVSREFAKNHSCVAAELAGEQTGRDPRHTSELFPGSLALHDLAREGQYGDFANSFLMLCSADPDSKVMDRLMSRTRKDGELAWHYAQNRRVPTETRFVQDESGLHVVKICEGPQTLGVSEIRTGLANEPVHTGLRLSTLLSARAYFGRTDHFDADLDRFLRWSLEHWKCDSDHLRPEALDALATNVVDQNGVYKLFDLEWKWIEPIPRSWFIFRNVLALRTALGMFGDPRYSTLRAWYERLCEGLGIQPDFERDIALCRDFQYRVVQYDDPGTAEIHLRSIAEAQILAPSFLRRPETVADLHNPNSVAMELARLRKENGNLKAEMTKTSVRIARAADKVFHKIPGFKPLLKKLMNRTAQVLGNPGALFI